MKPILSMFVCAAIAASLVGCGMKQGKTRTSSTAVPDDTARAVVPERTVSERTTVLPDDTRVRTVEPAPMHQSTEDIALASAVKERIVEDRVVDSRRIRVEADRGTVYLNGTVDSRDQKNHAEQQAMQVAGVSTVVNQLRIGDEQSAVPDERRSCTFMAVIPATRTESSFGAIEMRVYNDIASSLYRSPRDQRSVASRRDRDLASRRDIASGELRATQDRPPDLSEVTPKVPLTPGEKTPSGAGPTGGTMQSTAAQQGGTLEQTGRSGDMNERILTPEERDRLYREEARLTDRRGAMIWSGWLKNGERLDLASERGPIRYDYRYSADERFHDNKGAWCNDGNRIIVP